MKEQSVNEIIQKIVASGKISKEEIQEQIDAKTKSLGGLISQEGAAHIIANELGIAIASSPTTSSKIGDLSQGMKNVNILAKVLQVYEIRTFGNQNEGKVGSILVGDETGLSRVTFWNDKTKYLNDLIVGDVVEIQHTYTKENNNRIEIHMGNASHCIRNPEGKTVEVKEQEGRSDAQKKNINDIEDSDSFVSITATIVQIYNPRFFEVCPECNKRLREEDGSWICPTHGPQEPQFNYVLNVFLDDGSGNIRATFWKEQTNDLFSLSSEEFLRFKDDEQALEEAKMDLLGHIISLRARVQINQAFNSKELVAYEIDKNPKAPLEKNSDSKESSQEKPSSNKNNNVSSSSDEENLVVEDLDDEEILSIDDIDKDL